MLINYCTPTHLLVCPSAPGQHRRPQQRPGQHRRLQRGQWQHRLLQQWRGQHWWVLSSAPLAVAHVHWPFMTTLFELVWKVLLPPHAATPPSCCSCPSKPSLSLLECRRLQQGPGQHRLVQRRHWQHRLQEHRRWQHRQRERWPGVLGRAPRRFALRPVLCHAPACPLPSCILSLLTLASSFIFQGNTGDKNIGSGNTGYANIGEVRLGGGHATVCAKEHSLPASLPASKTGSDVPLSRSAGQHWQPEPGPGQHRQQELGRGKEAAPELIY